MGLIRKGKSFYIEVFNPNYSQKFAGKVIYLGDAKVFITHFKHPEKHFYIKQQGYPLNEELLTAIRNARVDFILIPEDGKTGFKVYVARPTRYFKDGTLVNEPKTERQRVIPLREMKTLGLDKEKVKGWVYNRRGKINE